MKNKIIRSIIALSFICLISIVVTLTLILIPNMLDGISWTLFILPLLSILVVLKVLIYHSYSITPFQKL
jgi:uncharacterized membrane protein